MSRKEMIRYVPALLVAVTALLAMTAQNLEAQNWQPQPADDMVSVSICQSNHFEGCARDCNNNPVPGETVVLTYPDGSRKTCITNSEGKFCFAHSISPSGTGWPVGYYGLTTRCMGKLVYRAGDGDIEVDLSVCCPNPVQPK